MIKKLTNIYLYIFTFFIINCGHNDRPIGERVIKHEKQLKEVSDSISIIVEKIDSLILK